MHVSIYTLDFYRVNRCLPPGAFLPFYFSRISPNFYTTLTLWCRDRDSRDPNTRTTRGATARRRRKNSRHQRSSFVWAFDLLPYPFAGHVTGPSFPIPLFLCLLAHGRTSRYQRIVFGLLLVTSVALLSLLFLCACARASPAIVSLFFVAVCFVWYASFDTPIVYTSD